MVFRYTAVGLRMQSVVESHADGRKLSGVNSGRVSTGAWMLTSFVAGLAGVLLPQITGGQVVDIYYTTLVTAAIVAAVLAALTSIPMIAAGRRGMGLGIVQEWLNRFLPTNSVIAANVRPGLPFIALFLVLAIDPRLRHRRTTTDPLAGVDSATTGTRGGHARTRNVPRCGQRVFWAVAGIIYLYYVMYHGNESVARRRRFASRDLLDHLLLDRGDHGSRRHAVVRAGDVCGDRCGAMSSQLAAQQRHVGDRHDLDQAAVAITATFLGIVWCRVPVAAPRRDLPHALFTFAFALAFENVFLKFGWVTGGIFPEVSPRPQIGPVDFSHDKTFLVLCLVVLGDRCRDRGARARRNHWVAISTRCAASEVGGRVDRHQLYAGTAS